jgi:hypothetical protein
MARSAAATNLFNFRSILFSRLNMGLISKFSKFIKKIYGSIQLLTFFAYGFYYPKSG